MRRALALALALPARLSLGCTVSYTRALGCHYPWESSSCPEGYRLSQHGDCGWLGIGSYRTCTGSNCCAGYGGDGCLEPQCSGGCVNGLCASPGACTCDDGYTGAACDTRTAPPPELTVLSINFACRDVAHLAGCDNCRARFDLIARAIRGDSGFAGVPDLAGVDVVLAQELGTAEANFAQIAGALAARGFTHTTGAPAPTAADPQCADPPGPLFGLESKAAFSALSGLESGGLVTFSKHRIAATARQNWCAHNLPAPAGYLSTLLDVGGVAALVVNVHLFPEYDFGVAASDVRMYQFAELGAFADAAAAAIRAADGAPPFAVVLGGDFNEDAYGLASTSAGSQCDLISGHAASVLAALNLDVRAACAAGAIGEPTWSPSGNDLAARFSAGGAHEVLDYLVMHSSSAPAAPAAPNAVATLEADAAWSGTFCESSVLGTVGATSVGEARSLTDHNAVTATFALPDAPADGAGAASAASAAFEAMLRSWRSPSGAQEAACGQRGARCAFDSNCCEARLSWSDVEQHCDYDFRCAACAPLGASCGSALLQLEGSPCCGYDDYETGEGAHCEMTLNGPVCVRKYDAGSSCVWDEECKSRECSFELWAWPPGKYCQH